MIISDIGKRLRDTEHTLFLDLLVPKNQIVSEETKNHNCVAILRLGRPVQNLYCLIERMFRKVARSFWTVQDIAIINREVER